MRRPMPSRSSIGDVMEGGTVSEVVASNAIPVSPRATSWWAVPAGRPMRCPTAPACARSIPRRADLDRARRPRHAGHDRLRGAARDRQAQAGRDRGGRGSVRARSARWSARSPGSRGRRAVGIAGGRGEMRLRRRGASASTPASIIARPTSLAGSPPPARKASTSISRMSAARCLRPSSRC